jgi:hypothetical protein
VKYIDTTKTIIAGEIKADMDATKAGNLAKSSEELPEITILKE